MKKVHHDSSAAPSFRSTLEGIRRAALVILTALVTANANHIASPDLHVDRQRREIRMYFHGPAKAAPDRKPLLRFRRMVFTSKLQTKFWEFFTGACFVGGIG